MKIKKRYLALFLFVANVNAEQTVLLKVTGIDDKTLNNNVRIYLSQLRDDEADGSERYQEHVKEKVDQGLRAVGYYDSQYHFELIPKSRPKKDELILKVGLNKPIKLNNIDIEIVGEAEEDRDFSRLLLRDIPKQNSILNHGVYEDFKSKVDKLAQAKGYFDGEWAVHRLEVYPKEHIADWRLHYHSGKRYRYNKIQFVNSQIRRNYLENILRIKEGAPYYLNDLSKLSSDFSSSNWFSSVLVEPEIDEGNKTVDLNLLFQPKKKNEIEVGVGFVTDTGPRFQLGWKKPWLNDRGHSIESQIYISKPEQSFEFGYKVPVKSHPINYYYQMSGGIEKEKQNDTEFTGAHLGLQRFWNHETGWAFSFGVKTRYDAFKQGNNEKRRTLLLYPTASLNRTRSDGSRFPLWGDSQKLAINWGSKAWRSDVNFHSMKISTAWIRTFFNNHRTYLKAEIGYLKSSDFARIPPILRYFAGGDMSIRGFGYKDISPRDSAGKLTGATHLATATVEYQYQVYPSWWLAAFYDTGLAAKSYEPKNIHSGIGAGIRWASPIGAIKFDIATPVRSPNNQKDIQFYIGLGSEL